MNSAPPAAPVPTQRAAPDEPDELSGLTVVPARYYGRWLAGTVTLVLVAQFGYGLATNPGWEWSTFFDYLFAESVLKAVWLTVQLTFYGTALGFTLGVVLAVMRLSSSPVLRGVAWTYIWAFRSIPLIVQLLFWFNLAYLYQELGFGIPFGPVFWTFETMHLIGPITAAVIGLALHQAAYAAEIVRGGIIAVDPGQREAAAALGLPRLRQFRRIVLPQAMRGILPNAANEIISLFKGTSIVSVMAVGELFYQVQVIYGRNGRVVPLLMVATVWYILLTTVLSIAQHYVERRFARGAERQPVPGALERLRRRPPGAPRAPRALRRPRPPGPTASAEAAPETGAGR
ncbi:amino acid ABC transporter permease [Streptomyces profundus]|uniref:amino acid ABC transporter permease n=1 Tax=Streptomyces profundus TaxID=2867410 RepID=UPI001D165F30|nr:amino acid ABC transporter permease [Streptomyces sp. MA3_2.13]UED86441.1 amino acid ABC transporter permease [Streptomyces sp. MA3_2.13]